ncbi:hypothetical protein HQ590_05880 [bacterium]|nr:hypothetical protein [bacterium]
MKDSPSLADKFQQLKSLSVDLSYYAADKATRASRIKYVPNLANAKSVFRFDCPNTDCVGGDFELTEELAQAVATHRTSASGELRCRGWQNKTTIDVAHCHNILRYTLSLGY